MGRDTRVIVQRIQEKLLHQPEDLTKGRRFAKREREERVVRLVNPSKKKTQSGSATVILKQPAKRLDEEMDLQEKNLKGHVRSE